MTTHTGRLGGHNALGLNQLDGHLGALARLLSMNATFAPEGEGAGSGEGDEEETPPKRRSPNSRSRRDDDDDDDDGFDEPVENARGNRWRQPSAYEIQLRKEAAKYRKRAQQAKDDAEAALARQKADADAALNALKASHAEEITTTKTASDTALTEAQKASDARVIRLHVKSALTAADCQNVDDALKLIDGSAIKITNEGDVEGVDALVDQLKKDKAYLFAAPSTTTTSKAPKPTPGKAEEKTAADMTPEEYATARAAFTGSSVRRRRSA